jgi:UDP-N-acetylglucosamine:LPS N-acetylglucosamine transferase
VAEQQRILILTSKTGGGHVSLAEALRDRLSAEYTAEIVDPQPTLFHTHYRLVSRYALWLWAAEFRAINTPWRSLQAHRVFTQLVVRQLGALLDRVQPDAVITTYPFLSHEARRALLSRSPHIPFVMLFTDPEDLHASWLTERAADATFAPTRETYAEALAAGFSPARLHLTGWPVRDQFYQVAEAPQPEQREQRDVRAKMLRGLGLDPGRFTVFLQGGGEGAARFALTVETVLGTSDAVQVILACGTNAALLARFTGAPRIHALPFTREIAPYMAAADVVMGKAGPNMLFEATTLGKPFIATAYIPGQEEANLAFIQRHGLGWVALRPREQGELLATLSSTPDQLRAMVATVDAYRAWNAEATEAIPPLVRALTRAQDVRRTAG